MNAVTRWTWRVAAWLLVLVLLFVPPVAAQGSISRDQELSAGRIASARLIAQYPVLADADWLTFLGQLRDSLEPFSGRTDVGHQIIILDTDVPNAASTPGYLFVTSGLIRLNLDRDAWAFVVAHELAHTAKRHVAIEIEKARGAAFFNVLVTVLTGSSLTGDLAELLVRVAGLGHSRDLELEADAEGLRIMTDAGFNPEKAVATLQFFNESTGHRQEQTHWAGTHPGFAERVERLTQVRQRFIDQGLPLRILYFTTEARSDSLVVRLQRMAETGKEWTFTLEAENPSATEVSIDNTAIRLLLTDGRAIESRFLRSTFGNMVAANSRMSGTVVFERPDSSPQVSRLVVPVASPGGQVDLTLSLEGGGAVKPAVAQPKLARPPSP